IIPNMVNTHSDWNGISSKLRQAFENFRSTYNDEISKLANHLIRKKRQVIITIIIFYNDNKYVTIVKLNSSDPSNREIEGFIAGAVWETPLKKHIDILNYDVFKNQQSGVKALMTLVAKSLKIHLEYLIAESRGENPDYTSMVLNRVKKLDYITIDITFPAA
ncbi:2678_t:CDS:1, partial [Racocetra fulgida]